MPWSITNEHQDGCAGCDTVSHLTQTIKSSVRLSYLRAGTMGCCCWLRCWSSASAAAAATPAPGSRARSRCCSRGWTALPTCRRCLAPELHSVHHGGGASLMHQRACCLSSYIHIVQCTHGGCRNVFIRAATANPTSRCRQRFALAAHLARDSLAWTRRRRVYTPLPGLLMKSWASHSAPPASSPPLVCPTCAGDAAGRGRRAAAAPADGSGLSRGVGARRWGRPRRRGRPCAGAGGNQQMNTASRVTCPAWLLASIVRGPGGCGQAARGAAAACSMAASLLLCGHLVHDGWPCAAVECKPDPSSQH